MLHALSFAGGNALDPSLPTSYPSIWQFEEEEEEEEQVQSDRAGWRRRRSLIVQEGWQCNA